MFRTKDEVVYDVNCADWLTLFVYKNFASGYFTLLLAQYEGLRGHS